MFENQKILILGFARSGYEAAKFLIQRGNQVVLNDSKQEELQDAEKVKELRELGVEFVFGSHPDDLLDSTFDYLIKNPGVPIHHKYVLKARELGIEVINEVEMAYRLFPKNVTLIGITGTNGKTTTTSLTYAIVKEAFGDRAFLAGNIGFPLSGVLRELKEGDVVVMEVSCQQLANLSTFHPNIAVMTNLSPAHIDFFGSYEVYKKAKAKLFQNQTKDDVAILNVENADVLDETKRILSTKKFFSSENSINGCYLDGRDIYYYDKNRLYNTSSNIDKKTSWSYIPVLKGIEEEEIRSLVNNKIEEIFPEEINTFVEIKDYYVLSCEDYENNHKKFYYIINNEGVGEPYDYVEKNFEEENFIASGGISSYSYSSVENFYNQLENVIANELLQFRWYTGDINET